jgi:hypothetical protein
MLAIWESDELTAISDYFHDRLPEGLRTRVTEEGNNNNNIDVDTALVNNNDNTSTSHDSNSNNNKDKKKKKKSIVQEADMDIESAESLTAVVSTAASVSRGEVTGKKSTTAVAVPVSTLVDQEDESWMDNNNSSGRGEKKVSNNNKTKNK